MGQGKEKLIFSVEIEFNLNDLHDYKRYWHDLRMKPKEGFSRQMEDNQQ